MLKGVVEPDGKEEEISPEEMGEWFKKASDNNRCLSPPLPSIRSWTFQLRFVHPTIWKSISLLHHRKWIKLFATAVVQLDRQT